MFAEDIMSNLQIPLLVIGSVALAAAQYLAWRRLMRAPKQEGFAHVHTATDVAAIERGLNAVRSDFGSVVYRHSQISHPRACLDGARQAVIRSNYFQALTEVAEKAS